MASAIPCHKLILCGEYGAGKSSLFRRFVDNSFTTDTGPSSTRGLDHFSKTFRANGREISIELWDTAGIERFATLSSSYFQNASGAILCYSIKDRHSFNMLSQHILEIIMHSETAKIFLCGNKYDLASLDTDHADGTDGEVTDSDIESFTEQCDAILSGIYKVSCLSGIGVKEMFADIANVLSMEVKQKFDSSIIQPSSTEEPASRCFCSQ